MKPDLTKSRWISAYDESRLGPVAAYSAFGKPGDVEYVPAARLDAANLEIARLRAVVCSDCFSGLSIHRDPDGTPYHLFRGHLRNDCPAHAALTPKEPSDE